MFSATPRRSLSVAGAAFLMAAGLTLAPLPSTAAITPAVAAASPDDTHPIPDRDGSAKPSKVEEPWIYHSCAQVRLYHRGPLWAHQRGYNPMLDDNNDGIACNE